MLSVEALRSILNSADRMDTATVLTQVDATLIGVERPAPRLAISLACTLCRSRHLKCDGQQPCSRCSYEGHECIYVKSRRGYKGPRRLKRQHANGEKTDQVLKKAAVESVEANGWGNGSLPPLERNGKPFLSRYPICLRTRLATPFPHIVTNSLYRAFLLQKTKSDGT